MHQQNNNNRCSETSAATVPQTDNMLKLQESLLETLCTSVVETVRFYADSGDLLSAAHIALIFYDEIIELPKFSYFLRRVLKSYFDTLQQLQLHA